MKRILLAAATVLLTAVIVVVSTLGSTPRTVHMAALDAIQEGDFSMARSHLKRSDHPDAELLLSYMYFVPDKVEIVTSTEQGDLTTLENYVYNRAGRLVKHETTTPEQVLTVRSYTYSDLGLPILFKTEITDNSKPVVEDTPSDEEIVEEETGAVEDPFTGNQVEYFYDEFGRLLCERTTDSTGLFYQYRYSYDALGRTATEVYVDGDAKWTRKEYTYDGDDDRLTEKYTDHNGMWQTTTFTYLNEICRTETVENSGGTWHTVYSETGDLLTHTYTGKDGVTEKTVYTYSVSGRILREEYPDGRRVIYTYNDKDLCESIQSIAADGSRSLTTCTYDEDGHILSRIVQKDKAEEKKTVYTYNKKGQMTKKAYTGPNGEWKTTEYEYDRDGNPETIVATDSAGTVTTTLEWKVRYYPTGMPENVQELCRQYDVDKDIN